MRIISGFIRLDSLTATRCQSALLGALVLMALPGFCGCKKSKPPVAETPAPQATVDTNQSQAPAPAPTATENAPAPATVAASPDGTPDLKALNQAYIGWIVQNRQRPKNLDEFFKLSGIQFPPPPAGKKYVIDGSGFINLANQ
jgi:hypothetical protein